MGSIPSGRQAKESSIMKFSRNAFSTRLFPVTARSVREVKKLSHSHPARSREGQSIKISVAFCRKVSTAAPILSEGDVLGCVVFLCEKDRLTVSETEYKLAQTIAGFLGRHMEG